ncbi:hypothetical protein FACS189425_02040 [Clostridia bacterium]|nr:hypothetical protein FACS189425_02040 [Clostridia bacterium]
MAQYSRRRFKSPLVDDVRHHGRKRSCEFVRFPLAEANGEYATLLSEKKSLGNIKEKRETMIKWAMVKNNVERFLAAPTLPRRTLERGAR